MLLPGSHPVFVVNHAEGRLRQRLNLSQVPQSLHQLLALLLQVGRDQQKAVHAHRAKSRAFVLSVGVNHAAFHHHAVFHIARHHIRHGFGQLAVHGQRHFQPMGLIHPEPP